jgi:hypothetical protein
VKSPNSIISQAATYAQPPVQRIYASEAVASTNREEAKEVVSGSTFLKTAHKETLRQVVGMKLVRVSTTDTLSLFSGNLSSDLVVAPNSSIALKSLSLEQRDNIIEITSGSDKLTYIQGATTYVITIPHGQYTLATYTAFLTSLQGQFNNSAAYTFLGGNSYVQGMEYRIDIDSQNKFQFQARKGDLGEQPAHWTVPASISYDTSTYATNEYSVNVAVGDGNCEVMTTERRMPNGNGYCSAMAALLEYEAKTDPIKSGIWICSTYEDLSQMTTDQLKEFVEDDARRGDYCNYGVGITRLNGVNFRYSSILNGVPTTLTERPSDYFANSAGNPVIRLQTSAGRIYASWSDDAGLNAVDIAAQPANDLYQFIVIWNAAASTAVGMTESSLSAFDGVATIEPMLIENVDKVSANPGLVRTNYRLPRGMLNNPAIAHIPDYYTTANRLTFENSLMAAQFGFLTATIPPTGPVISINYVATGLYKFGPRIVADTLIVLSQSMPIESYDTTKIRSGSGQQQSILDVVPVPYGNEGIIAYQPSDLVFLDLNNISALNLRTIKFRIVTGDYTPLVLNGLASIVFLVKGQDEK